MRILFLTDGRMTPESWSGTIYAIFSHLKSIEENGDGDPVELFEVQPNASARLYSKVMNRVKGGYAFADRSSAAVKSRRRMIASKLASLSSGEQYDALFCVGSLAAAGIPEENTIPVYIYLDGIMSLMRGYYYDIDEKTFEMADRAERAAMDQVIRTQGKIFAASEWVRDGCIRDYQVPGELVEVVRIGSNNFPEITGSELETAIINSSERLGREGVSLLFVGYDWKRKGLAEAFDLARILLRDGEKVSLHVVGCNPPVPDDLAGYVKVHGALNKMDPENLDTFVGLYKSADFFVFPTHAECAGAVISEAGSCGLPVLANRTGGVPSMVEDGVNGFLHDLSMQDWADRIEYYRDHLTEYAELRRTSFRHYKEFLNWDVICRKMSDEMKERIR